MVKSLNNSLNHFEEWKVVRERCVGDFEGRDEVDAAIIVVEKAVEDRNYLTWRPPNGESVVDLRNRIRLFLNQVQLLALRSLAQTPTILVVSHAAFMNEFYYLLSEDKFSNGIDCKAIPKYHNTGIAQYHFRSTKLDEDRCVLEEARCDIFSCASHLRDKDDSYKQCYGGCCND